MYSKFKVSAKGNWIFLNVLRRYTIDMRLRCRQANRPPQAAVPLP
jgi:hypothetical protein